MEVPAWEGSSLTADYPPVTRLRGNRSKQGRKRQRLEDKKHSKELERLISGTVQLGSSPGHTAKRAKAVAAGQPHHQSEPSSDKSQLPKNAPAAQITAKNCNISKAQSSPQGKQGAAATGNQPRIVSSAAAHPNSDTEAGSGAGPQRAELSNPRGKAAFLDSAGAASKQLAIGASMSKLPGPTNTEAGDMHPVDWESGDVPGRQIREAGKKKKRQQSQVQAALPNLPHEHDDPRDGGLAASVKLPSASVGKRQQVASRVRPQKQEAEPALAAQGLLGTMRSRLQGSHFRWLNEQMYTQPSAHSMHLMASNPAMFQAYHEGFQEQTKQWPQQPLDAAVAWVAHLGPTEVVADFGCGTAQLAQRVPNHVISLDLVAAAPGVLACDMAHTPLEDDTVDAVVFCLALMGTNYGDFIAEALRVLRPKGRMWIAEVRSRFAIATGKDDYGPFQAALQSAGLAVDSCDASNKMFVVFEARKSAKQASVGNKLHWPVLKACTYKRR